MTPRLCIWLWIVILDEYLTNGQTDESSHRIEINKNEEGSELFVSVFLLKLIQFWKRAALCGPSPIKHHAPSAALLKASVQTKQETTWGTLRQGRFPWRQYSDYRTVWLSDGAFFLVNVTICQSLLHSISITLSLTLISVVQFVLTESQKYHPRGSVYSTPYVALPSYFSWQAKLDARFSPTL